MGVICVQKVMLGSRQFPGPLFIFTLKSLGKICLYIRKPSNAREPAIPLPFSVWGEGCGEQLLSDANMGKLERNVDCFYCNRRSEQTEKPTLSDPKQAGGELTAGFRQPQAPPLPSEGNAGEQSAQPGPVPRPGRTSALWKASVGGCLLGRGSLIVSSVGWKAERTGRS